MRFSQSARCCSVWTRYGEAARKREKGGKSMLECLQKGLAVGMHIVGFAFALGVAVLVLVLFAMLISWLCGGKRGKES